MSTDYLEYADVQYTVVEYNMVRYVYSAAVETERRSGFKRIMGAFVSVCVRNIFVLIFYVISIHYIRKTQRITSNVSVTQNAT